MKKSCIFLVIIALVMTSSAFAADWPQFQGPNRDGKSPETGLLDDWPDDGLPVLWTVDLGPGFAGPAVKDGKVYVLDRPDNEQDVLRCFDFESGKELWRYAYDAPGKLSYNGSRTVPLVTDKHVYTIGPFGDMNCISLETHKPVWSVNLLDDFGAKLPGWGVAHSPIMYKDIVIGAPQGKDVELAAMNKDTGEVVWKSPGMKGDPGYVSPVVTTIDGVDQVVMLSTGACAGFDLETGEMLWQFEDWNCKIPITFPVPIGDGRLFITGGYNAGSIMLKVSKNEDAWKVEQLYHTRDCGSQVHQPILIDGYLYMNSNSNSRHDGMLCLSLDGKVQWKTERDPNYQRGNLVYADGKIYNLEGDKGNLHLIDPNPEAYKELDVFNGVLSGKQIWGPMAIANGRLVLRDQTQMKCLDISGK